MDATEKSKQTEVKVVDVNSVLDDMPDGGLRAWLVVLGVS